jgi:hypothetical protein
MNKLQMVAINRFTVELKNRLSELEDTANDMLLAINNTRREMEKLENFLIELSLTHGNDTGEMSILR